MRSQRPPGPRARGELWLDPWVVHTRRRNRRATRATGHDLYGWAGLCMLFFFQAEGGIRDLTVTGVQTCALPISRVRGLEGGADDYLTKPFDLSELIARVHALIRRAELRHQNATLTVGDLALDPLKRRVTQGDRVVDLSPREFALLEFLMRNAGRTVSRSRIAEAVWNYKYDPETNVVDVYVNYLRKKLSFAGRTAPIRTVRGSGYRLEGGAGEGGTP